MAIRYIKNCTGDDCGKDSSGKKSRFSKAVSRFIFHILFLAFIGVSIYILFFSQYLKITNIDIQGTQELKNQDLRDTLQSYLDGKFLGVVPKNNFLLVSQKKIASLLEGDFKKIRSVAVAKKFPDSISITIDERKSLLVWCAGADGNCFLIDENGTAYTAADFNSAEITQNHLIKIIDQSARSVAVGEKIIEPDYERYAISIKDALKGIGQEVEGDAYGTPSAIADEINVKTKQGMQLYFSTQFPLESATQMLDVVWKKEIPEDKRESVDYIDLRSEGRVFYKFKSTETQAEPENKN